MSADRTGRGAHSRSRPGHRSKGPRWAEPDMETLSEEGEPRRPGLPTRASFALSEGFVADALSGIDDYLGSAEPNDA